MGWFDDDEVFTAEVVSQKIWEDEATPIKTSVITAIKQEADIHDYIMAAHYNSYGLFVRRYLRFGEDTDKYPPGLPTSYITGLSIAYDEVEAIIAAEVGEPVTVDYIRVGTLRNEYLAYTHLQDNYNWNYFDNLTDLPDPNDNFKYYSVYDDGHYDPNGVWQPATFIAIWYYLATEPPGENHLMQVDIPYPGTDSYQVEYHLDTSDADHKIFWLYFIAEGTYPQLDDLTEESVEIESDYLPIVPIRENGVFIDEKGNDELTEGVERILKKIQLDYADLKVAVSGSDKEEDGSWSDPENANDDLDKVDDVYFLFGVDVYTETQASIEYLWLLGLQLKDYSFTTKENYNEQARNFVLTGEYPSTNFFTIVEGDFNITIMYNYVDVRENLRRDLLDKPLTDEFTKIIIVEDPVYHYKWVPQGDIGIWIADSRIEGSHILIRKRTGPNTYSEMRIDGPIHRSKVRVDGNTQMVYRYLSKEFRDPDEDEDEFKIGKSGFYFPVSTTLLDELGLIAQEIVLYDAGMLSIYAGDFQTIKWYTKGVFKVLMVIVMVVITVVLTYFFGATGLTIGQLLFDAFMAAALAYVVGVALDMLIQLVPELAIALAILTIAIAIYRLDLAKFAQATFADKLIAGVQTITKVVNSYTSVKSVMLQMEAEEFLKDAEQAAEELADAKSMLEQDTPVYDPLYVSESTSILNPSETPAEFYLRTLTTNPGILGFEAMHSYADNALALPKLGSYDMVRPETV